MPDRTVTAVINLDLPGPPISRHIYGHFAEHLGRCIYGGFWVGPGSPIPNVRGIRSDVVEALRAIHIPNLRWPGGCFADTYHWRDGIGPRDQRPRMVNSHWGDVVEDNSFGTHEFMDLCEMLGAQPYICGNLGSGTVQEMSDWIEYLTRADDSPMAALRRRNGRDEPWRVPFWGLGNETWGCGGNMSPDYYADQARQYATFVRNHGGNTVYRIAVGPNADDYGWTETVMKRIGCVGCPDDAARQIQGLSLHYYTMNGSWSDKGDATVFTNDDYYVTMRRAWRMGELVRRHKAIMDCYDPCRKIGLVVDEWGTWWNVEPGTNPSFLNQQNTLRDALVASVHFDIFHANADRIVMANIAQTVNVLQSMIATDPVTGALVVTPTYHVFAMNVGHHDAHGLDVRFPKGVPTRQVEGAVVPMLTASASVKGRQALVSLSNLDTDEAVQVVVDMRGRTVSDPVAMVLTADTLQAHNTPAEPDAVRPRPWEDVAMHPKGVVVTLPPHSYMTVSVGLDTV